MECCLNFFMIFLNIEKNKITNISFFLIFHVFFAFHAISNIKKNWCKKKNSGGGGVLNFFFRKTILSYFTFYAIFNITKIETPCLSVRRSVVISRGADGPGREILQRPPSVCLSVCPSVRHV